MTSILHANSAFSKGTQNEDHVPRMTGTSCEESCYVSHDTVCQQNDLKLSQTAESSFYKQTRRHKSTRTQKNFFHLSPLMNHPAAK